MMILLVEMAQVDEEFPTGGEDFSATQKLSRKRVSRVEMPAREKKPAARGAVTS